MYSLTFRVRVATPAQYGRNGTASLQITSHTQQARRFYHWCVLACVCACVRSACGVRWACGLPLGSATHFHNVAIATHSVHRLQIRPIVHNLDSSPTTPPSYIRVRAIVWACGRGQTDRQTKTKTRVTTIHFSWSTTHTKCKYTENDNGCRLSATRNIDIIAVTLKATY